LPYVEWRIGEFLTPSGRPDVSANGMSPRLAAHAEYAAKGLQRSRVEISNVMAKHQLRLVDRQCRIAEVSQRLQDLVVMLVTSLWAGHQSNEVTRNAADILCQDLTRRLTGRRPTDAYFRAVSQLGETIASGGFEDLSGVARGEILMPYPP
jgi:hypothetical protein